jgi:hypothetical protein
MIGCLTVANEITEHEHAGDDADENPDENHEAIEKLLIAFLYHGRALK